MRRRLIGLASAIVLALFGGRTGAQSQTASGHPDLSGYWELRFDSFNLPRAVLTTAAQAATATRLKRDLDAIRGCVNVGLPALMNDRATLDIRQSASVIGMVAKAPSSTRYIYTDGRKHPDAEELEGTTNGHSIGRWNGDALLVDTVGFNDRGITAIPGGGYRTSRSHLVEGYRLSGDGQQLVVTFTWTDPVVFRRAHTYAFRYYKASSISEPRVVNCIANDAERARFLSEVPMPLRF